MKYDEDSNIGYFLEVEVESPERVGKLHNNMSFSQKKSEACKRLINLFATWIIKIAMLYIWKLLKKW